MDKITMAKRVVRRLEKRVEAAQRRADQATERFHVIDRRLMLAEQRLSAFVNISTQDD